VKGSLISLYRFSALPIYVSYDRYTDHVFQKVIKAFVNRKMEVADQGYASLCNHTGMTLLRFIVASKLCMYERGGCKCRAIM
jgi:hypothetical protein